ncbi:HNH endonuclease [Clostridium estertheticum]|uniref:HNH endonuclease n=1 Tax=Clostridium estertheticum TaxID=238834 RepID=UPI001C0C1B0B|nr:HNH endonuclease [Clostridium estertheticum]WAG57940.1 HNH endonuclease [Clostridium estertheticum]
MEGHHTKQISDLKEADITNVNDIMLVCANCHRILHKRRPCLSKEEIKELLVLD